MRKIFFMTAFMFVASAGTAFGLTFDDSISNCQYEFGGAGMVASSEITVSNCSEYGQRALYWKGSGSGTGSTQYSIRECNVCASGYIRQSTTYTSPATGCKITYYRCTKSGSSGGTCPANCPYTTSWYTGTNTNNRQAKCVQGSTTKYCIYRCKSGYYATSFANMVVQGDGMVQMVGSCAACPTNGTCAAGVEPPVCKANYYRTSTTSGSGFSQTTTYKCPACPTYATVSGNVQGSSSSGSTSITQCYIPQGKENDDDTGVYEYTDDCYYKSNLVIG